MGLECKPMECCPTCGQKVEDNLGIAVDLDNRAFIINGKGGRLAESLIVILFTLVKAYPGAASSEKITSDLYGSMDGPEDPVGVVRSLMVKLRDELSPYGVGIENVWGTGYRVVPWVTPKQDKGYRSKKHKGPKGRIRHAA